MVAYYFPPIDAAGTHRTMNFSRELEKLGWKVTVISCSDFRRNTVDPNLIGRIGRGTRVKRAPCTDLVELAARMKAILSKGGAPPAQETGTHGAAVHGPRKAGFVDYLSRLFKTPDSMLAFVPGAVLRAWPEMMCRRPDVIYSSAPPFSCHLAALCLKSLFRVPWVADFRDPWASNPFRNSEPYPTLRAWNQCLEAMVVKEADLVVSNTAPLEADFRRRYPHLDRFVTLSNGFDPTLLQSSRGRGWDAPRSGEGGTRIVHTGEVYGLRSPRSLIAALGELRAESPGLFQTLRLEFFGKVHELEGLAGQARELGVEKAVFFGGHVEHDEALRRSDGADILLLLGVMGRRPEIQVPSKIFEYLALRKPILSLSKRGGAIHGLLEESGVPFLIADLEDKNEIKGALERAVKGDFDGGKGWDGIGIFAFDRLARRLSRLLGDLKHGRAPAPRMDGADGVDQWTLRAGHA
jgi:glycosyltransferase involved in cell wall biosynthesis